MLYRHLLFHALRASLSRTTTTLNFLLSNFLEDRHEEGDLLLKAGVGGSLHFLPGKIEGRNYLSENHNYANGPPPPTLSLY